MSSIWVKFVNWRNGNHGAAYRTRLFGYDEYVPASDLAAARAEIERPPSVVCGLTERCDDAREAAEKAIAERDAAMALLADAYGAGTGGSVIESHLAEAERDMRQRAADACRISAQDQAEGGWRSEGMDMSRMLRSAILALPLKHADREGG